MISITITLTLTLALGVVFLMGPPMPPTGKAPA